MVDAGGWIQMALGSGLSGLALLAGHWIARKNYRDKLVQEAKQLEAEREARERRGDNEFTLRGFQAIQEESEKIRVELRERIQDLEKEIADLRREVESSREERELIHQEYIKLRHAHEKLLVENARLRADYDHLKRQLG